MTQRLRNYVRLCRMYGTVKGDSFKKSYVFCMNDGIMWVDVYADSTIGIWFNYPARGLQVRL